MESELAANLPNDVETHKCPNFLEPIKNKYNIRKCISMRKKQKKTARDKHTCMYYKYPEYTLLIPKRCGFCFCFFPIIITIIIIPGFRKIQEKSDKMAKKHLHYSLPTCLPSNTA
jgi:hypothetical protein